jgi:transcription elongation factor Elf1
VLERYQMSGSRFSEEEPSRLQYPTPFSCQECGEHTFETEAEIQSPKDFADSVCTSCGNFLDKEDLIFQLATIPKATVQKTMSDAATIARSH